MDKASLRSKYQNDSDDHLIDLVQNQRDELSIDALKVIEEILIERGYEIEHEDSDSDPLTSKMEEGQSLETIYDMMNQGTSDRINDLIESIEEDDRRLAGQERTRYDRMSDEDLIEAYAKKIKIINLTNGSGDHLEESSMDDFLKLSDTIFEKRKLTLPENLHQENERALRFLNGKMFKKLRQNGWRNLFIGLAIFLIGLVFTLGSGGRAILYGAVIIGFFQFIGGVITLIQTPQSPPMPKEAPPKHFRY